MTLKCGIVGLPNIGKSTLFNALTSSAQANVANYPFCTINKNSASVSIPDYRLKVLRNISHSIKYTPAQIEFIDIAGIVKNASKGEGLGNRFLSHIREVDAIVYVLRCFENTTTIHVEGNVDPVRDAEIMQIELTLADIQSLTKQLVNTTKKEQRNSSYTKNLKIIKEILTKLDNKESIQNIIGNSNCQEVLLLNLLTSKPFFYVCNINKVNIVKSNTHVLQAKKYAKKRNTSCIVIDAKIEQQIATIKEEKEKNQFLEKIGLKKSGLENIFITGYMILNLITYFTVGPKEVRAWTIKRGLNAKDAAAVIHTDFSKGFICAEVISYTDYIKYGSEQLAKQHGRIRQEGRKYIVQDGDIITFKFNVNK